MKKRILSLTVILSVIMSTFSAVPVTAMAADSYTFGYYTYEVNKNGEATITDVDDQISGDIVIPEELDGYPVVGIEKGTFSYCDKLKTVKIPDSIRTMGQETFWNCSGLTAVEIGDGITTIPWRCFLNCSGLKTVDIGNGVIDISSNAFENCISLKTINWGTDVKTIGDHTFDNCISLTSLMIPDTVIEIGDQAFYGCNGIKELTLGTGVSSIGKLAFAECDSLKEVVIPDNVVALGGEAFFMCDGLTKIVFGAGLTSIPADCCRQCYGLKEVTIGENVVAINTRAFQSCNVLKMINGGSNLITIESYAFAGCPRIEAVVIPDSVREIGSCAFQSCSGLEELTIGTGVTDINSSAFAHCGSLKKVVIPDNVISLGRSVFYDCKSLTEAVIGSGVTVLPAEAFSPIESLKKIYISENVNEIETWTFWRSKNLKDIYYAGTEEMWNDIYISSNNEPLYSAKIHFNATLEDFENSLESMRISGANRFETSFMIADTLKETLKVETFDTVIIASGTNFADALAGSYLAAKTNAPILMTSGENGADIKAYIKENVTAGGTVYILGGSAAVPTSMESGLNAYTVKRLSGTNRYETNLAILREAGVENEDILIATGTNFADSLSASATGKPILLVGSSLTKEQKEFLHSTSGDTFILGGTGAVSKTVENEIGDCTRIAGENRYETSVLIAEKFFDAPDAIVLASGLNFPDGLCGGPLAYAIESPMILTAAGGESAAKIYVDDCGIDVGITLGGTAVLPDSVVGTIILSEAVN